VANTLLTISEITQEALRILENALTFTKLVNRSYEDRFGRAGAKIGDTVNVRKPPKYVGRTGANISLEDTTETSVPVQLNKQFGVDISFSSQEMLLSVDDFGKRYLLPAVARIANEIDKDGCALYTDVYSAAGTPATVPNTLMTYLDAGVRLDDEACPRDGQRSVVVGAQMQATIVDALKGLFQASAEIGKQYRGGQMGTTAGFDWYMDQNVRTHTVGPLGGTPLVNGAAQSGASLVTDGWTASAASRLKKGDTFTIANVYGVNPISGDSTGVLRRFVVTADVSSDGSGNATIPISPSITATGAFKTVSAAPADNAAITVLGAANAVSPVGLAFHPDAFTLACADLPVPDGVDMASRKSDKQLGLSIRLIRQYAISTDTWPCRLDVLYGWKTIRPELACRIHS
jgi:P22 coat protein - gene protein 5